MADRRWQEELRKLHAMLDRIGCVACWRARRQVRSRGFDAAAARRALAAISPYRREREEVEPERCVRCGKVVQAGAVPVVVYDAYADLEADDLATPDLSGAMTDPNEVDDDEWGDDTDTPPGYVAPGGEWPPDDTDDQQQDGPESYDLGHPRC